MTRCVADGANPPAPPWATPQQAGEDASGFFRALFDFSFSQFVTLKFAKFIYALLIVLLALGYLVAVVFYRMAIEFVVATIRTAQNTSQLVGRR